MLWKPRLAQCLAGAMAMLVAGCQSTGLGYLRNGIGSDLPASDISAATKAQTGYFNHLCIQAGLATASCDFQSRNPNYWTLVVHQGMNDIDRRCDAYLEWLDNRKRGKGPWLSQISAVRDTTTAIIGIVDPGSAAAINIVGQAFGLLTKSVENYNSRLLVEIESSTINSVVLRARSDFRRSFQGKAVDNKPDAEFVLREYLRRCLPFAIETQINDLSTLGARGIEVNDSNSIFQGALGSAILRDTPKSSREKIRRSQDPRVEEGATGSGLQTGPGLAQELLAITATEKRYRRDEIEMLQRKLCADVTGRFDEPTREAISKMQSGLRVTVTGKIDNSTQKLIVENEVNGCNSYRDTYEKFRFRGTDELSPERRVADFQKSLGVCVAKVVARSGGALVPPVPVGQSLETGGLDEKTRSAIDFVLPNIAGIGAPGSNGALTPGNIGAIGNCRVKSTP